MRGTVPKLVLKHQQQVMFRLLPVPRANATERGLRDYSQSTKIAKITIENFYNSCNFWRFHSGFFTALRIFSQFSLSFIEEFNPGYVMCEGLAGRCVELTVHLGWFVCRVPTAPEMPCQPIHQVSEDLQNDQEKSFDGPA